MRGRSNSAQVSKRAGFFAETADKIHSKSMPVLTQSEIDQRTVEEIIMLGETAVINHMITFLGHLKDRETAHQPTIDAIALAYQVVTTAGKKMQDAAGIGIFNAWSFIREFNERRDELRINTEKVVSAFGEIQVTDDTRILWQALAVRVQAFHDITANRYHDKDEHGKPAKVDGAYPTLDSGDALFKRFTKLCKYDMIEPYGRVAGKISAAINSLEQQKQLEQEEQVSSPFKPL